MANKSHTEITESTERRPSQMAIIGHTDLTDYTERSHHRWWGMESPKARNDTKFESKLYKKKKMKNTFRCFELFGSSRAKCYVFVFKSELLRPSQANPYHITALLQTSKRKNSGFSSLKNKECCG
jgi:hypothetical protein